VAGYEGAKAEIAEVVDFLRSPTGTGGPAPWPPGVLMVGPPGTGKTLLPGPCRRGGSAVLLRHRL